MNLNLTIGLVDAIDMKVDVQSAPQFISPITTVEQISATDLITATESITLTTQ